MKNKELTAPTETNLKYIIHLTAAVVIITAGFVACSRMNLTAAFHGH